MLSDRAQQFADYVMVYFLRLILLRTFMQTLTKGNQCEMKSKIYELCPAETAPPQTVV